MEDAASGLVASSICGIYCCMGIFNLVWIFIMIAGIAVWIWMLIDVIQRKDEEFPNKTDNEKLLWLLIVLLAGWIGSIVYYFMVYKKIERKQ